MYLTTDIYSSFKHTHLYGRAGDEVEEIGSREDVKIVQGKDGQRFPVCVRYLTDKKPEIEKKFQTEAPPPQPTKRQTSKQKPVTKTLF
ncbi:hypothetical protein [Paraflavitalea pollutisoli]|uniref:hypothetical protein n=1 Tax=Paraflavitalea pollutisoli TaxID=3034143 RepID=UPI0023EE1C62|nr:hypothetical protein [Paraflavitalea sp. H1-2-19X]